MKNRVVLITGSSIGIGRFTAYEFAKAGADLILTYYQDREEGEKTRERCLNLGARSALLLYLNLMDDESILGCIEETASRCGRIDVLINNAGVLAWKPLREQSFGEIEAQVRINLEGLIKLTKTALPYVREIIINVGSGAGKRGFAELTTYCATKFGVRGFTQALAQEEKGIRVYSVNPGMTATRMTGYVGADPRRVAEVIYRVASGNIRKPSGSDVDAWDYL
ncbi:SDR family NAD(P)-dependent oxidoreductase [Hydrogenivirga sp.]